MLWTALILAAPIAAASTEVEVLSGQPAIDVRQPSIPSLISASDFESLEWEFRSANHGQTALVYGWRAEARTQDPIAVLRLGPDARPWLISRSNLSLRPVTESPQNVDDLTRHLYEQHHVVADHIGPARWWALGDVLRLARAVTFDQPTAGMQRGQWLVDAVTGDVLDRSELATEGLGHDPSGEKVPSADIFELDPILTPEVVTVELPESTRHGLVSTHFDVQNCLDLGDTYSANTELGRVSLRTCTSRHSIPPDSGQWRFEPVPFPADPARDEDSFSGPQLLWHGEQTIAGFVELGLPLAEREAEWRRLDTLANYRLTDLSDESTMSEPSAALRTYDNAFFRRGRESSDGTRTAPELVFGQGSAGDFAYDADVITHELGHFAVWTQGGPSSVRSTEHGSSAEPGALNEGLADYFAAIRADDPVIGTYSGESLGRSYIRTLSGSARCPDSLYGQVHADSQPFSQALWSFRESLDASDRVQLDRCIVDALPSIGSRGGFDTAVEAIVAEVQAQLSAEAADALFAEFASRSVDACEPFVPVAASGTEVRSYTLVPAFYDDIYSRPIPGYVQFVIDEDGPLDVTLEFIQRETTDVDLWGTNEPKDLLVLHSAGDPIVHDGYTDDATDLYVWDHNGEEVGTAVRTADLGPTFDGSELEYQYTAEFRVEGDGPHHLQLANLEPRAATARALVISWSPAAVDEDTAAPQAPVDDSPSKSEGCSCASTEPVGAGTWLLALLMLGLTRRQGTPRAE